MELTEHALNIILYLSAYPPSCHPIKLNHFFFSASMTVFKSLQLHTKFSQDPQKKVP